MAAGKHWKALVIQSCAAEEGAAIGMLNAAFMLRHGSGYNGSDRHALAFKLLLRAAHLEQYYGDGLVDAAAYVYDGDRFGIPGGKNLSKALALYREAAERNDTEGMTGLAWMLEHGQGVTDGSANTTLALHLYWKAVEGAPDAHHAASPLLLYAWLRTRLFVACIPGMEQSGVMRADLFSVLILIMCLLFVVWLRRSRAWMGPR